MPENFTPEQNAQLQQMQEPLQTLDSQIWRMQHEPIIDRGIRLSITGQLKEVADQLRKSVSLLEGTVRPPEEIRIGLPDYQAPTDTSAITQLPLPNQPQSSLSGQQ